MKVYVLFIEFEEDTETCSTPREVVTSQEEAEAWVAQCTYANKYLEFEVAVK